MGKLIQKAQVSGCEAWALSLRRAQHLPKSSHSKMTQDRYRLTADSPSGTRASAVRTQSLECLSLVAVHTWPSWRMCQGSFLAESLQQLHGNLLLEAEKKMEKTHTHHFLHLWLNDFVFLYSQIPVSTKGGSTPIQGIILRIRYSEHTDSFKLVSDTRNSQRQRSKFGCLYGLSVGSVSQRHSHF